MAETLPTSGGSDLALSVSSWLTRRHLTVPLPNVFMGRVSRKYLQTYLTHVNGGNLTECEAQCFDRFNGNVLKVLKRQDLEDVFKLPRFKAEILWHRLDRIRTEDRGLRPVQRKRPRSRSVHQSLQASSQPSVQNGKQLPERRGPFVKHARPQTYRHQMGLPLWQRLQTRPKDIFEYERKIIEDPNHFCRDRERWLDREYNRETSPESGKDAFSDEDSDHRYYRQPVHPNIEDYLLDSDQESALKLFREHAARINLEPPKTLRDIRTVFSECAERCYHNVKTVESDEFSHVRMRKVDSGNIIEELRKAKSSLFKHCASPNRANTEEEHAAYIERHPPPPKPVKR